MSHVAGFTSTGSKRTQALFGDSPGDAPRRMSRSLGCRVWDEYGREYLDYVMALGAVALGYGHPEVSRAAMDAVQEHRERAQPVKSRTGGSTFKNPDPPGTPNQRRAWQLIDAAGCRGLVVGGAQVSELHCNFLINRGGATAADIETLGETVRRRVRETSGVELEWEIKRIGVAA